MPLRFGFALVTVTVYWLTFIYCKISHLPDAPFPSPLAPHTFRSNACTDTHTHTEFSETNTHAHLWPHTDKRDSHTDLGSNFRGAISRKHLTVSVRRKTSSHQASHLCLSHSRSHSVYDVSKEISRRRFYVKTIFL